MVSRIVGLSLPTTLLLCCLVLTYPTLAQDEFARKPVIYVQKPEAQYIHYWYRNFDSKHTIQLIELALTKTRRYSPSYQVVRGEVITQGRAFNELRNGSQHFIRVINAVTDEDRERFVRPVRIANSEGLSGLRVCIINRNDQARFVGIKSQLDLDKKNVIFGQGTHWPDTKILLANGLNVETSVHYETLFPMLRSNRFNCFLRSVEEVHDDLRRIDDPAFIIEPTLLFAYPSASLFFVNDQDTELAARLELGLRWSLLDGSFKQYFQANYGDNLQALNLNARRTIRLNNPYLSDKTLETMAEKLKLGDGKIEKF